MVAEGRVAAVAGVAGGVVVVVLEGGQRLRPALIQAPPPEGGPAASWPPAHRLREALAEAIVGERVSLHWPRRQRDRHGRLVGHLRRQGDGLWVQAAVVSDGLAVVMPFADETADAGPLLALEEAARTAGRGLWADPFFAVRDAATVGTERGRLRLVAGTVRAVAEVGGTTYLNFGADWRRDFTGLMDRATARACRDAGRDPKALEGRRVRLRGWMRDYNGPLVEITACDQIEVLSAPVSP
jgi:endonuclease YncB( thermonuclease family)